MLERVRTGSFRAGPCDGVGRRRGVPFSAGHPLVSRFVPDPVPHELEATCSCCVTKGLVFAGASTVNPGARLGGSPSFGPLPSPPGSAPVALDARPFWACPLAAEALLTSRVFWAPTPQHIGDSPPLCAR